MRRPKSTSRLVWAGAGAAALAAGLALVPRPAYPHQQGVSYSDVTVDRERVLYDLTVPNHDLAAVDADQDGLLTADEILAGYPVLRRRFARSIVLEAGGERCTLDLQDFTIDPTGAILFRLRGRCSEGTPLRIGVDTGTLSGTTAYNFAKIRYRDEVTEHVFGADTPSLELAGPRGALASLRRFFLLGVEHIATGYDHVLFLLALLITGGGIASLVGIVSAFTVAHSATLALATLEIVTLPGRLVESAIALSIAWIALENMLLDRTTGRWRITFVFGLVHGFGFATILRGLHLPSRDLVTALFAFNLGVEAGQIGVVLVAAPIIVAINRTRRRRTFVVAASAPILVLALYWFVTRAFLE